MLVCTDCKRAFTPLHSVLCAMYYVRGTVQIDNSPLIFPVLLCTVYTANVLICKCQSDVYARLLPTEVTVVRSCF